MTRILVTGGAGYVGSVSVAALLAAGHTVMVLDDLSTGHAAALPEGARLYRGSYGDEASVRSLLVTGRIEAILHCAARSLVGESIRNPATYYRDNVAGGIALLEAARQTGVQRFVFSSTAAVYGTPDDIADPRGRAAQADQPVRRDEAHARDRARVVRPGARAAQRDAALLQRRRRHGDARRGPRPRDPPHPERPRRRRGRAGPDGLRRRLPHARRDVRPRLHPRRGPRRRAPARARGDRAGRPPHGHGPRLQPRQRRRLQHPRGARRDGSARRPRGPAHGRAATAPATRRSSSPAPSGPATSSAGSRKRPSLDEIIGSALEWRRTHPRGYRA